MQASLEDDTFASLLRGGIALVVAPPGSLPPQGPRLRGLVRPNAEHARIIMSDGAQMNSGIALEFELHGMEGALNVEAAIDFARTVTGPGIRDLREVGGKTYDSADNLVIKASAIGFTNDADIFYDNSLINLLSLLVHGAEIPYFEDAFIFSGFLLQSDRCRIYIRTTAQGTVYGVDIPLTYPDGSWMPRFGGSLPRELYALVRDGDLLAQDKVQGHDDYCVAAFDMTDWVAPPR